MCRCQKYGKNAILLPVDNYEELYDIAEGNFGLVTYAQAKAIGISIRELDRWVKCGRLEKPTRGVYRVARFPSSEKDPYAVATEAIGLEAYLYGESVLQLLNLVPTNPTWMYVASPKRVRKRHGESLVVLRGATDCKPVNYDGIRCQPLKDAIRSCRATVRPDRRIRAVQEGLRQGYLGKRDSQELIREIKNEASAKCRVS